LKKDAEPDSTIDDVDPSECPARVEDGTTKTTSEDSTTSSFGSTMSTKRVRYGDDDVVIPETAKVVMLSSKRRMIANLTRPRKQVLSSKVRTTATACGSQDPTSRKFVSTGQSNYACRSDLRDISTSQFAVRRDL
jgi:hypothetical protein